MPYEPRGMWCSNHICGERELQRRQAIHHARIQQMKPMVDQRDPRRRMNVNSKAARQNEERNAQIFYENSLLLDKLSKILTRPNSAAARRTPSFPGTEKLHEAYRKQERDRIHRENQALLRRLQYSKPCIDTAAFEEHWQQQANFAAKTRSLQANPNLPQPRPRVPGSNSDILPRRQRPFSTGDMERARRNAFESKSVGTSVKYTSSYKIGDNYSNNGGGDYARGGRHGGGSGGGRGGAGAGAVTAGSERRRGSAPSLPHGLGEAPLTIPEEASEAAESIGHDAVQGAEQPDAGSKAAAGAAEAASVRSLTRAEMDARVGAAVEAGGGAGDQAECVGGDGAGAQPRDLSLGADIGDAEFADLFGPRPSDDRVAISALRKPVVDKVILLKLTTFSDILNNKRITMKIGSYLSHNDILAFSLTSKSTPKLRWVTQPGILASAHWRGTSGYNPPIQWQPLPLGTAPHKVHSTILKCRWRDQGRGNKKGMISVIRAGGRAPDDDKDWKDVVVGSAPAPRPEAELQLAFRPEADIHGNICTYNIWVRIGDGGGHELSVRDLRVFHLMFVD